MHQHQQSTPAPNLFKFSDHKPASEQTRTRTGTSAGTDTMVVSISPSTELLAFQIQAFLRASHDELDGVVIDEEIVKDILDALPSEGGVTVGVVLGDDESNSDSDATGDLMHLGGVGVHRQVGVMEDDESYSDCDSDDTDDTEVLRWRGLKPSPPWLREEAKSMIRALKDDGPADFISEYVDTRSIPIPWLVEALGVSLCPELRDRKHKTMLYFLQVTMAHARRKRDKLARYNTIEDAVSLINQSRKILVLTGAGISVSCGIPDFRSRDGLYASLKDKGEYELDDPQQMFDIDYFRENPAVFYNQILSGNISKFVCQIYPSNFEPSPCHQFIKLIEDKEKLLRNYTQNIDTLEMRAGVTKVLQCHGSFATASCLNCRRKVAGREIESEILDGKVPLCVVCNSPNITQPKKSSVKGKKKKKGEWDSDCEDESDGPEYPPGVMKPDITFFGEKLSDEFDRCFAEDRFKVDLLLVIGTSLNVSPVAEILSHLPHSIPQILINKTPVRHINPDIILLGNADDIVIYLCERLGWELPPRNNQIFPTQKRTWLGTPAPSRDSDLLPVPIMKVDLRSKVDHKTRRSKSVDQLKKVRKPRRVSDSHVWLFEGAEGGKWLERLQHQLRENITRSPTGPPYGGQEKVGDDREGGERKTKKQRVM